MAQKISLRLGRSKAEGPPPSRRAGRARCLQRRQSAKRARLHQMLFFSKGAIRCIWQLLIFAQLLRSLQGAISSSQRPLCWLSQPAGQRGRGLEGPAREGMHPSLPQHPVHPVPPGVTPSLSALGGCWAQAASAGRIGVEATLLLLIEVLVCPDPGTRGIWKVQSSVLYV